MHNILSEKMLQAMLWWVSLERVLRNANHSTNCASSWKITLQCKMWCETWKQPQDYLRQLSLNQLLFVGNIKKLYWRFQSYAATHRQIHGVKVVHNVLSCHSNTIPAFSVFYSGKLSILINQLFTNESFRSNWVEIKHIRVKFLFNWRQSIANNTPWILSVVTV